jgi:hypothetical protein
MSINVTAGIKEFINKSENLTLSDVHAFSERDVFVKIHFNSNAKKVLNDLVKLVKFTPVLPGETNSVYIINCVPELSVNFSKNVTFWNGSSYSGTRITKTTALEGIQNWILSDNKFIIAKTL